MLRALSPTIMNIRIAPRRLTLCLTLCALLRPWSLSAQPVNDDARAELVRAIDAALEELRQVPPEERTRRRREKFLAIGSP